MRIRPATSQRCEQPTALPHGRHPQLSLGAEGSAQAGHEDTRRGDEDAQRLIATQNLRREKLWCRESAKIHDFRQNSTKYLRR
jgi:hypothetical protein